MGSDVTSKKSLTRETNWDSSWQSSLNLGWFSKPAAFAFSRTGLRFHQKGILMNSSAKVYFSWAFVIVCCSVAFAQGNRQSTKNFVGRTGNESRTRPAKNYTCTCDSPCSGSITCTNGCYAYCEKNAGRNICVKGCASEVSSANAAEDTLAKTTRLARFSLHMPAADAVSLMKRVFGIDLADAGRADRMLNLRLRNVNLNGILKALSAQGVSQPRK